MKRDLRIYDETWGRDPGPRRDRDLGIYRRAQWVNAALEVGTVALLVGMLLWVVAGMT